MKTAGIAVVTGANKGLGLSIVKNLCEKFKGTVYLTSRDEKRGKEAFEKLKTSTNNLKYYQLDVSDEESIKRFCEHLQSEQKTIDILINNAGILFLKDSKEAKTFQAEQTILVNFHSLANFTEAVLSFINKNGTILNVSSSSGHLSRIPSEELRKRISCPDLTLDGLKILMMEYVENVKLNNEVEKGWGDSPYVVSKVGVNAYTFQLNRKLADRGITVNCVHPGYVMSDMTRGAGSVTPDEAAKVVTQVALDPKGGGLYIWHNGQEVPLDGTDPRGYIDKKWAK